LHYSDFIAVFQKNDTFPAVWVGQTEYFEVADMALMSLDNLSAVAGIALFLPFSKLSFRR
jgi:hypothetical protein